MNLVNSSMRALLACALVSPALADELKLPREGWVSWQVAAVDKAPGWCCYNSWKDGDGSPTTCQLDGSSRGYGLGSRDTTTDSLKVYARLAGGKIERLQALAAGCPVESKTPIQDLGSVPPDDSARWLIAHVKTEGTDGMTDRPIGESALAALSMHRGDVARDALAGFARNDASTETRKWAVFWLAMGRGAEGADIVSAAMFNDPDEDLRKHAAFAMSQTHSARAAPDLIKLGNTDKSGEVRAQAWFWLAQTGAPEAEKEIAKALRKDGDDDVREQAIFALSQLPGERATKALIAAAEDQSLTREQRKRAVFWLSQSNSDSAQAYLEKVLARNVTR